jgi:hypothetical protein
MAPSPPADKRTLIRRVTFDLIGLPPTPGQVEDFIKDDSPDAYEKLVDRLLASPDYGVHWARHWLDLARFGESNGFERDQLRPNAWRYRDWVVDAFNSDMPYDRFVRMQLAGNIIEPGSADGIIATGFLVATAYDQPGDTQQSLPMRAVVRQDQLEDIVGTVSQTFLGLTANCARCHNHKFDPIAQREYYQLASALSGVRFGERDLPADAVQTRAAGYRAMLDRRIAEIEAKIAVVHSPATQPVAKSSAAAVTGESIDQMSVEDQLHYEIIALKQQKSRAGATKTFACVVANPGIGKILIRGNPAQEGATVSPAGVAAIIGPSADFGLKPDAPDAQRRRKLAEWITDARNPLFARVIVNRLWLYHFGDGIVETPNDFGFNGGRPSHPELLDWLATQIQAGGWSIKKMQWLIVTSTTYRQSSQPRAQAMQIDTANRMLWRMNPRRIEAEELRDAILQVAGELNPDFGGPGYEDYYTFTKNTTFYEFRDFVGATFNRRSLYRTWTRSGRSPMLDVFDCPDPSTKTPRRSVTTTPLQALALFNDSFIMRMSDSLAAISQQEAGPEVGKQVTQVYQKALCRAPTPDELADATDFVRKHGLAAFCRVMMNSSEFLVVD